MNDKSGTQSTETRKHIQHCIIKQSIGGIHYNYKYKFHKQCNCWCHK